MNERIAPRRTRNRRRKSGGYTLIELMVVVVLIALLAMIGAPSFAAARGDRLCFTYARTVGELVHNARARAASRGAAHLFLFTDTYGARGAGVVFEALDGTTASSTPVGPSPVQSCKTPHQWDDVVTWVPGGPGTNNAGIIDALNINDTSNGAIEVKEGITMTATGIPVPGTAPTTFVLCMTPNGTTYYGSGADIATAITAMQAALPFTDTAEIDVARHDSTGVTIVGLKRRVLMTGGAAPRIKSE